MARKRKSDMNRLELDEVDRNMYRDFSGAANSLSQLYSQSMHQQRLSFHSGGRHALETLYAWILRQQEDGVIVMSADITSYIQNELDHGTEDPPSSPRLPFPQQQQFQTAAQSTHVGITVSSNAFGSATIGQGLHSENPNQTKTSVSSSNITSPIRHSLQNYHLSDRYHFENNANPNRDPNPPNSYDALMDMHADDPDHNSPH